MAYKLTDGQVDFIREMSARGHTYAAIMRYLHNSGTIVSLEQVARIARGEARIQRTVASQRASGGLVEITTEVDDKAEEANRLSLEFAAREAARGAALSAAAPEPLPDPIAEAQRRADARLAEYFRRAVVDEANEVDNDDD